MAIISTSTNIDFEHGGADGATYATVPGVLSFTPGAISADTIDTTDYDSPSGFKEFASGLKEGGEGTFSFHFDKDETVHVALRTANGGAAQYFKATLDGEAMTMTALVTGFDVPVAEPGSKVVGTCTFKLTGAPTYA